MTLKQQSEDEIIVKVRRKPRSILEGWEVFVNNQWCDWKETGDYDLYATCAVEIFICNKGIVNEPSVAFPHGMPVVIEEMTRDEYVFRQDLNSSYEGITE